MNTGSCSSACLVIIDEGPAMKVPVEQDLVAKLGPDFLVHRASLLYVVL